MSAHLDVAGRLAEGLAAVDNTQTYVAACAARGFHHPDLTLHGTQVRDWYGTEDGLDLEALDADCAALRAAAQSAADALRCVRGALTTLGSTWEGGGGSAAGDFVTRHGEQAQRVAAAVDAAAGSAERLRDELWRIIGAKVDSTVSLDDRAGAQRPSWLAAARTVIAGGPEAEEAAAVVDSEVRPFVETVVAGEWLTDMRAAVRAVAVAYRAAVDVGLSQAAVRFDIPGDLVPLDRVAVTSVTAPVSSAASPAPGVAPQAPPAPLAPMAPASEQPPSPTVPSALPAVAPNSAAPPSLPPVAPSNAAPLPNPTEALGSGPLTPAGAPGLSGGDPLSAVGGLPGRVADALGGLFSGAPAAVDGASGLSEPDAIEPPGMPDRDGDPLADDLAPDEPDEDEPDEDEPDEDEPDEDEPAVEDAEEDVNDSTSADGAGVEVGEPVGHEDPGIDDPAGGCPPDGEPAPAEPESEAVESGAVEPEAAPPPPPVPAADPSATPCEIAADELPQVGE